MDIVAYQNISNIITAFSIAGFILFIISSVIRLSTYNRKTEKFMRMAQIIFCLICVFGGCLMFYRGYVVDRARADAHYAVYLDGERVDETKIDITLYRRSYNDEKKEVYITRGGRR